MNVTAEANKYNTITAAIQPCLPLFANYPDNQGLFSTLTRHQHGNSFANEVPLRSVNTICSEPVMVEVGAETAALFVYYYLKLKR